MNKIIVDVVGTGIGGLATAFYLSRLRNDVHIRLWEKEAGLGGLAGTFSTKDFTVEKFYHHLFRSDSGIQRLIQDAGLGADCIEWKPALTGAYYFKQPFRLSSPLDLLRFKPLPFWSRIRMGLMVLRARGVKRWQDLDDISVKDYIIKTAGEKVYEVVWRPLLEGKFGQYAERVSAAWLWCKLVDRGSSRSKTGFEELGYVKGGFGTIYQAVAKELLSKGHEIKTGQSVKALRHDPQTNRITQIQDAQGQWLDTDQVAACIHTPELAALLPDTCQTYKDQLLKVGYLANVCLILTLSKSLSQFYWTNVTEPNAPFVGIIEQTKWTGTDEFGGKHFVYISAYVPQGDQRLSMEPKVLLEHYLPYIKKIFPHFDTSLVLDQYLWKAPYTQPIVEVGFRHIIPALQTPISNMVLASMAQIYPQDRGVSNGADKGREAAEYLAKNLPR
jgi:protoporphyrinogen oxidase